MVKEEYDRRLPGASYCGGEHQQAAADEHHRGLVTEPR